MLAGTARWIFDQVHKRNLIYNQCCEDPRLDHEALQIRPHDRIVMITSAGCNALDYVLHSPERIDCVDMNPHQTALLELKLAAISNLKYEQIFEMFGRGKLPGHRRVYLEKLRDVLSETSREIWDGRIEYFNPNGPGLYLKGTAGTFARLIRWHLNRTPGFQKDLAAFQEIRDLDFQAAFYRERIAPRVWTPAIRKILDRPLAMCLLGVPVQQMELVSASSRQTLGGFIERRIDHLFTKVPIRQNYFWRAYMNGGYSAECCPEYLRRENFHALERRIHRIRTHTTTLTDFLRSSNETFSIFVLLDHMDWMIQARANLDYEWQQILRTARPGARIIFRSAAAFSDHIPDFAVRRLRFDSKTTALHQLDRVGTYGSFHMATVGSA